MEELKDKNKVKNVFANTSTWTREKSLEEMKKHRESIV